MTIWPFFIGHFVELPYTLIQDCTLAHVLGEVTPQIWFDKLEFLKRYNGMALLNTHPDYLYEPTLWKIYTDFLVSMKDQGDFWHALPKDVADWWRTRVDSTSVANTGMYDSLWDK